MPLLKCPGEDRLLEFVSIPQELSFLDRANVQTHLFFCKKCESRSQAISQLWSQYFSPAPDLTSSLIKVYSKLQNDETLILKGWKIGELRRRHSLSQVLFREGWLFRGAVSFGLAGLVTFAVYNQLKVGAPKAVADVGIQLASVPMAQIRFQRPNHIQVHYVQPELLESVEFETTSGGSGE